MFRHLLNRKIKLEYFWDKRILNALLLRFWPSISNFKNKIVATTWKGFCDVPPPMEMTIKCTKELYTTSLLFLWAHMHNQEGSKCNKKVSTTAIYFTNHSLVFIIHSLNRRKKNTKCKKRRIKLIHCNLEMSITK